MQTTLAETKFYQVELLALNKSDIALNAALKSGDVSALAGVITQMAKASQSKDVEKVQEFDAKEFAGVLEKVGKLAVEIGKAKTV